MAKFRKRTKGNKGKRWAKGQSSSSNPTSNTYRDAAKSRFFEPLAGPSMLTKEALQKHDARRTKKDGTLDEDDEVETIGGKTFKTFDTFASDFSACSNQSFNKLIKNFQADSAMHKDMLAVLAAVTDVIKEKEGQESSTEYFGALMTALEGEGNTEETTAAILNLLSMGIKSVPANVLQATFSDASSSFMKILAKFSESPKTSVLRAILGCISVLLRIQDAAVWGNPYTLQVLDSLLAFITFSKPKVRKAAQHSITVIVRGSNITQNAISHIAKYCIKYVESVTTGGITITLHTFTLLKEIMHMFPKKEIKECCESVLKVMTMNNVLLTSCGLQVLHGMFLGRPLSLPAPGAAKLLNALYDYQPPPTDSQPTQAWLAVLHQAYLFLADRDLALCIVNCPKLFTTCSGLFMSDRPETLTAVTHTLQAVIADCLGSASTPEQIQRFKPDITKVVLILQDCLTYQYHPAWTHVLHLVAALFKACGKTCPDLLLTLVKGLVELRDSEQFTFINELENAIGEAVRSLGPEAIIRVAPLQINPGDKKGEFKRSWLLPVLKSTIKGSTLKVFIEQFLPLASVCRKEAEILKDQNDQIRAIGYDLLQVQIWSLLPSFANEATDIALSFPVIAKALGGVLNTRKDLRVVVLSALRKLVTFSIEGERQQDIEVMTKFAKNYLPILFVLYTTKYTGTDEAGTRLATFETIKVYLKIANQELKTELFDRAYQKLENPETEDFIKECVLDLMRALLPYQSKDYIDKLYEVIVLNINDCKDRREQKKYYRIMQEICSSESEALNSYLNENITKILELLCSSLNSAAPSSKGARLMCALSLLKRVDDPLSLAVRILPETILCGKDLNSKSRETAFKLIEFIANNLELKDYLHIIMAGLTGNPTMMSCSIISLSAVIYHLREKLPEEVEQQLLYNVGLLAICKTREVVGAALGFVKVYMQVFPRDKVGLFLPELVKILSRMTDDCKRHNRTKTRDILARLCRWFGADEVATHVPPEDKTLRVRVKNLAKIQNRRKKQKESASQASSVTAPASNYSVAARHKSIEEILAESDSDMELYDDEDDYKGQKSSKKGKGKGKVWIAEEGEDIVDFTDTKTTRKITATKPGTFAAILEKKKVKKSDNQFKTAPDGRLIIADDNDYNDDDDEGNMKKKKKKTLIPGLEDSDDDYDMSEDDAFTTTTAVGGTKRAMSVNSFGSNAQANKYQAGGMGIHRPIRKTASIASSKMSKKSKINKNNMPQFKTGQEYTSKKARGDMSKKGMPDPYAYLPLRRDALNKRKKMKTMGQIKNILKGAQKGAKLGKKMRRK